MIGNVTTNVLEYMNGMSKKQYVYSQVSAIANAITDEFYDRKAKGLIINGRTKRGKEEISTRVAAIANKKLIKKGLLDKANIDSYDVWLYKKCYAEEYTNRTGKCAWGYKELRQRWGFDPDTALEL